MIDSDLLHSIQHRNVIGRGCPVLQICGRTDTGKRAEVMDEMRLIEVTARERHVGEIGLAKSVDRRDNVLKTRMRQ